MYCEDRKFCEKFYFSDKFGWSQRGPMKYAEVYSKYIRNIPIVARRGCSKYGRTKPKLINELFDWEDRMFFRAEHGNYGEDGFFIVQTASYLVFGIADGVGSWWEKGVDPAIFSASLVKHACRNSIKIIKEMKQETDSKETDISALNVLQAAYDDLLRYDGDKAIGSSTACFGVYNCKTKELNTANLGDTGIYVRTENKFEFLSKQMKHFYTCTLQLTNLPVEQRKRYKPRSSPKDAIQHRFLLSEGDFFIVGSDGVWDNVDIQDMQLFMEYDEYKTENLNKNIMLKGHLNEWFSNNFFSVVRSQSMWTLERERVKIKRNPNISNHGLFYGAKKGDISFIVVLV